jgi:hypothetical protein
MGSGGITAKELFGVLVRWTGFLGFAIGLLLVIRETIGRLLSGLNFPVLDWAYSLEPGLSAMLIGLAIVGFARGIAFLAYGPDQRSN